VALIILGGVAEMLTVPSSKTGTSAPVLTTTPSLATPYVQVHYQTVGWFYSNSGDDLSDTSYNYTYLVLNVTITNYDYSQVNVMGSNGFSVLVDGNEYSSLDFNPTSMFNGSTTVNSIYSFHNSYSFNGLPNSATLLNTGSVNGIVTFQFGSPTVYPQQPQILNEPFTLRYSITYGNSFDAITGLGGSYARVVINQAG